MAQHGRDLLDCPFTHTSRLKAVGDFLQHAWFHVNHLIAHLLCLNMS